MRWTRSPAFVVAFLALDLAVLMFAYARMHQPADAAAGSGTPAVSVDPSIQPDSAINGPLALTAGPGGVLVRSTRGTCDSREPVTSRVWVAAGFKAPMTQVEVPGLQETLGVTVARSRITLVGADEDCDLHGYVSTDDGATWRTTSVPGDAWYLDTDTTNAAIRGPVTGGIVNLDCTPVAVETVEGGQDALVTCKDVNVLLVSRSRRVAPVTYSVAGPAAAATASRGLPWVLATSGGCEATLMRVTSQQDAKSVACVSEDGAALGLAVSGDRVFVQAGYQLLVSDDGGRSFAGYPGEDRRTADGQAGS